MNNWSLIQNESLEEHDTQAYRWKNRTNGLEILHLKNSNPELFAAYIFATPPENNKGIPHILEHLVFCGSDKFRIKDPFIELAKGSVNSFYNAMTYPDKTVFPFATVHRKDFFNILAVYTDAVFHPLLRREAFLQEGVRIYRESDKIKTGGVVFNEMLGSYAAHETIISEYSSRMLFSDICVKYDSGGEPADILTLGYDELRAYYHRYYTPANCRFFLFGDIEIEPVMEFLDCTISVAASENIHVNTAVFQRKWTSSRRFYIPGPADGGTSVALNWLVGRPADTRLLMQMELVSEILLGNHESPVYKLLVESGLGQDLSAACGLESDGPEMAFSIALRGLKDKRKLKTFETLVFSRLSSLAAGDIKTEIIRSSFEKYEFRKREVRGGYPAGFRMMNRMLRTVFSPDDPFEALRINSVLQDMRKRIYDDVGYISKCISERILANRHYNTVMVYPSRNFPASGRFIQTVAIKLYRQNSRQYDSDNLLFRRYCREKQTRSGQVPSLTLADISGNIINREKEDSCCSVETIGDIPVHFLEAETNGIIYFDLAFSCAGLEDNLKQLLPMFGRMLCTNPTAKRSREKVLSDIDELSGGIYTFTETSRIIGTKDKGEYFFIRLPVLFQKTEPALELLADLILSSRIESKHLCEYILDEQKNDILSSVLPSGNIFASLASASLIDTIMKQEEDWRGISQYLFLEKTGPEIVFEKIKKISTVLFSKQRLNIQVCSPGKNIARCREALRNFISLLKPGQISIGLGEMTDLTEKKWTAYELDSEMAFSALSFRCPAIEESDYAEYLFSSHYLANKLLWEEIRLNSGAYGANAGLNGAEGIFTLSSFRDPHVAFSLKTFREVFHTMLLEFPAASEMEKNIISIIGEDIRPMVPEEKSMIFFRRRLYGVSSDIRRNKINALLDLKPDSIKNALEHMVRDVSENSAGAVLAGKKDLAELSKSCNGFPRRWKKIRVL